MGSAVRYAETTTAPSPSGAPSQDDWRARARCAEESPDLFFPIGSSPYAARQAAEAKRVCARCPVEDACLAWALEHSPVEGVFGGTDPDERRSMLHQR